MKEWLQKQAKQQAAAAGRGKKKPAAGKKAAAAIKPTGGHDKKGLKRKAADLEHGAGILTRQGQMWTPANRQTVLQFVQKTHIARTGFSKVFFEPLEQTLQREKGARRR